MSTLNVEAVAPAQVHMPSGLPPSPPSAVATGRRRSNDAELVATRNVINLALSLQEIPLRCCLTAKNSRAQEWRS